MHNYRDGVNVTGVQHPLDWIQEAHARGWDVLVDCAAFVPLSFSKIFGYPTGVGCLLARKAAFAKLRRPWYAGGTITLSPIIAANMLERKEEGESPMNNILAIQHSKGILGVFAHPDDESFCAGGTFAKYVATGAEVMVVSATRGEAGQIRSAGTATRRTLAGVREQELQRACQRLGVQQAMCLDYADGTLKDVDQERLTRDIV